MSDSASWIFGRVSAEEEGGVALRAVDPRTPLAAALLAILGGSCFLNYMNVSLGQVCWDV